MDGEGNFGDAHGDVAQGVWLDRFYQRAFLMAGGIPILVYIAGTSAEQYRKAANMINVSTLTELFFVDLGGVILPKPAVRRRAMRFT